MNEGHDERHLLRAIEIARRGLYTARPNPCVGCVIVLDGTVVGEGWHRRTGEAHAEVNALAHAAARARGATAYVSLEPCCHQGRTGPCTEALARAGVSAVVIAALDPNPKVAGGGVEALRKAGIATRVLDSSSPTSALAEALNCGFARRVRGGYPWVRLKMAASLDARTAMASGESQWITGPQARLDGHRLRARSGAIVTGIGTVLADDPALTVRLVDPAELLPADESERADVSGVAVPLPQPLRVVLDSNGRIPASAKVLETPGEALVVTASDDAKTPPGARARIEKLPGADGRVNLERLLCRLAELEINDVLVEAGAGLTGAFLQAALVDEVVVYLAPVMLGDAARGLAHLPGLDEMADRLRFQFHSVERIGGDLRIVAHPARRPPGARARDRSTVPDETPRHSPCSPAS
ncbi:MAG: bifunctional diaminohydroxyphosphoribosylaminopyrimidine deaminase/5-amino-6-(5-phosphoribosylamino)uracil reductase RibD [Gammaproteobacteria bacterium]